MIQNIYEHIKDKAFFSRISGAMVHVVEHLPEEGEPGQAYFDGMMLLDCVEDCYEDGIQQMWTLTKDGEKWNLEDFYHEHGAFDEDGGERFMAALDHLMTEEEYVDYEEPEEEDEEEEEEMFPPYDIVRLVKACRYIDCSIEVSADGEHYHDIDDEDDEFCTLLNRLCFLKEGGLEHIRQNYKGIIWSFNDCAEDGKDQFKVKWMVEDDEVSFLYSQFSFKTRYTLIHILRSQQAWDGLGFAFFDNETGDIVEDHWYTDEGVTGDGWISPFDEACRKVVVNSHSARLFKSVEEDGKTYRIIDLIVNTDDTLKK